MMLDLILCVDDDPITLMLCKKSISKTTFSNEIVTAQNGEEALQYLNSIKPKDNDSNSTRQPL
jgi:CheY-like chemotaxis protein